MFHFGKLKRTTIVAVAVAGFMMGVSGGAMAQVVKDAGLIKGAKAAALRAAGGHKISGTLTIYGTHAGAEGDFIKEIMSYFGEATGVDVKYTGSDDVANVVQTQIAAGSPPDLYHASGTGELQQYTAEGKLVPLNNILDMKAYDEDFGKGLVDSVSRGGKVYGVFSTLDTFMIWYNPKAYTGPRDPKTWEELRKWALAQADKGPAPWAMASAQAWPMECFIESMLLKNQGPQKVRDLASGKLAWSSPEVKKAFQQMGEFAVSEKTVDGGPTAVLSTSPSDYGSGMFANPPTAYLTLWGEYGASIFRQLYPDLKTPESLDFMPVPGDEPSAQNVELLMGTPMMMFKDTEASRAFMRYWASPELQSLIPSYNAWVAGSNKVPSDLYKDVAMKKAAEIYKASRDQVVGLEASMSYAVRTAWKKTITDYIRDPSTLDAGLAAIDAATKAK